VTVKELIGKLEKLPPDLTVEAYMEFETDQGTGGCPGAIHYVGIDERTGRVEICVADYYTLEHEND
jgi:hypothetical protein